MAPLLPAPPTCARSAQRGPGDAVPWRVRAAPASRRPGQRQGCQRRPTAAPPPATPKGFRSTTKKYKHYQHFRLDLVFRLDPREPGQRTLVRHPGAVPRLRGGDCLPVRPSASVRPVLLTPTPLRFRPPPPLTFGLGACPLSPGRPRVGPVKATTERAPLPASNGHDLLLREQVQDSSPPPPMSRGGRFSRAGGGQFSGALKNAAASWDDATTTKRSGRSCAPVSGPTTVKDRVVDMPR